MDCVWVRRSRPVSLIYSTSHGRLWTVTEGPTLRPVLALSGPYSRVIVWTRWWDWMAPGVDRSGGLFGSGPTVAVGLHCLCVRRNRAAETLSSGNRAVYCW